jgi:hypothetical protein
MCPAPGCSASGKVKEEPTRSGMDRAVGIALSASNEPVFHRAICRLGDVLGGLFSAALLNRTLRLRTPARRVSGLQ